MQYVYVTSKEDRRTALHEQFLNCIGRQTSYILESLGSGMIQKNVGVRSISTVGCGIRYSAKVFSEKPTVYVDSGGYTVIKGNIPIDEVSGIIDSYCYYLENGYNDFDYIFSLDIPPKSYHNLQDKDNLIYKLNKESIEKTVSILSSNHEIVNKLIYVWHANTIKEYQLFQKLYDEHKMKSYVRGRAIGGLVGLRKISNHNYCSFIGITYKFLLDYLEENTNTDKYVQHFLGVSNRVDRFCIALLEILFQYYLQNKRCVLMSYDTSEYQHRIRSNLVKYFFNFQDNYLLTYNGINNIPESVIDIVYRDKSINNFVKSEIMRRSQTDIIKSRLKHDGSLTALNIFSNLSLDAYFIMLINKYQLVEAITNSCTESMTIQHIQKLISDNKPNYPEIFTDKFCIGITETVNIIVNYHKWYDKQRDKKSLENLLFDDIQKLNIKYK
jgi:hypothetical protein